MSEDARATSPYAAPIRMLTNGALGCGEPRAHDVAGVRLITDVPVTELQPYASSAPGAWDFAAVPGSQPALPMSGVRRHAGWVGGAWREVEVLHAPDACILSIEGAGRVMVARDGALIAWSGDQGAIDRAALTEALLGPALILALALRGTFCLHASAVSQGATATILLGEPGSGKSTLAAHMGGPWRRVCDDVLPVRCDGNGGVAALPRFPQLQLGPAEQHRSPSALRVCRMFVLGQGPVVALGPMNRRAAAATLLRQTVGAALFDTPLLAAHLNAVWSIASAVPSRALNYPRRWDAISAVAHLLTCPWVEADPCAP